MPTITVSNNPSISYTFPGLLADEFLPVVRYKEPSKQKNVPENSELKPTDTKVTLDKNIDNDKREFNLLELITTNTEIKLPFTIIKGCKKSSDDDGIITVYLTNTNDEEFTVEEQKEIEIKSKKEFTASYNTDYTLELAFSLKESKEFYINFHAKDDEDEEWNIGELENIFCGRIKVIVKVLNEWEFSKGKIDEIKAYAINNNSKYLKANKYSDYHHCTDTHKHIVYKLLDNPNGLDLGKDQLTPRDTPKDYEKAGESTTAGVRNTLITSTYAESPKTFTVIDINNKEVVNSNGTAGNTDNALKGFKESPIEYMKNKCPDNGYYVFIGAYNDDYHSFTVIVKKEDDNFSFEYVDQLVGVRNVSDTYLEARFLETVEKWNFNFPMYLRLYQLRNKKK